MTERFATRFIRDGKNLHVAFDTPVGAHDLRLLLVSGEHFGVTWSTVF